MRYIKLEKNQEPYECSKIGFQRDSYDEAMPWCYNTRGVLVHRPREVYVIIAPGGERRHEHINYYCASGTNDTGNVVYLDEPNAGMIVCQRCEAAAMAAGLPSSSKLAGRHVHVGGCKAVAFCCDVESRVQ